MMSSDANGPKRLRSVVRKRVRITIRKVEDASRDFEKGYKESINPPTPIKAVNPNPPEPFKYSEEALKESKKGNLLFSEPGKAERFDLPRSPVNTTVDMTRPSTAEELGRKAGEATIEAQRQFGRVRTRIGEINAEKNRRKASIKKAVREKINVDELKREIELGKSLGSLKLSRGVKQKIGAGLGIAETAKKEAKEKLDKSRVGQAFNAASKTFTAHYTAAKTAASIAKNSTSLQDMQKKAASEILQSKIKERNKPKPKPKR